jgi:hypothetical protein
MEKIKVTEFAIGDRCSYVIKTSEDIPPIKLYRLKAAIEDFINRDLCSIVDSTIEFTENDGAKRVVTKDTLDKIFKAIYPDVE